MPLALVAITTPILAILIATLWFKSTRQAKTIKNLSTSFDELRKDLANRRAEEAARISQLEAEATESALKGSGRKSKRSRKN